MHSTPLAGLLAEVGDEEREALEREVVAGWRGFEEDGALTYRQALVLVSARKTGDGGRGAARRDPAGGS